MAGKPEITVPQKIEIARRAMEKYATGKYTLASCIEDEGYSVRQFTEWRKSIAEITELFNKAKGLATDNMRNDLRQRAITSLGKLVDGFTVEEIHQEVVPIYDKHGNQIGTQNKSVKRIKKHFAPNVAAVIFTLKSMDPATFKDNMPPQQAEEQTFIINGKEIKF